MTNVCITGANRGIGLELAKQYALIYKFEGYGELATGIIVGLIDFNFCMPEEVVALGNHEEKVRAFGSYWEDHRRYKIGEL